MKEKVAGESRGEEVGGEVGDRGLQRRQSFEAVHVTTPHHHVEQYHRAVLHHLNQNFQQFINLLISRFGSFDLQFYLRGEELGGYGSQSGVEAGRECPGISSSVSIGAHRRKLL